MLLKWTLLFILIIFFELQLCTSLRILGVFPFGSRSHFIMTGKLMKELAKRRHQVDVINMFPQTEPIPDYQDIPVRKEKTSILVNNISYYEAQQWASLSLEFFARSAGDEVCKVLEHPAMQDVLKNKKGAYDVAIIEMFLHHCFLPVGQHLGAPVVGIVTSKILEWIVQDMASPLNPSYMPSYFSSVGQQMTFWERLHNTLITNFAVLRMNYYMEHQLVLIEKHFGRKLKSMKELYNDVSVVLVNSHHSINDIRPFNPDIIEIGGIHIVDDGNQLEPDMQKWLDQSTHGFVLFTFGSMIKVEDFPKEILKIFYEMFERIAPVRVLWKIVEPELLPPNLPKNVKIAKWIPQVTVLKHRNIRLFLTHGGLMGTQEAVVYKVPMVGLPVFADQHTNINSYACKKIAIALSFEDLTADKLTNAVKTVMNDPTYKKNIEKISNLFLDRPMSAIDTAIYWIEYTARHPRVLKSPAMELTWWQFYLLDVYSFLLASLLIVFFVIKKILILSLKRLFSGRQQVYMRISDKNK